MTFDELKVFLTFEMRMSHMNEVWLAAIPFGGGSWVVKSGDVISY